MLGAILATVATLAVSARLGPKLEAVRPRGVRRKDPGGVENPHVTKVGDLEAALRAAPDALIKTI